MMYNIDEPIDVIFHSINDLREIGELMGKSYTPQLMIDLGCTVVASILIFCNDIHRWLKRDPIDQTWPPFIAFFTESHQEFRETNASVDEISFQSENDVVTQNIEHLRD